MKCPAGMCVDLDPNAGAGGRELLPESVEPGAIQLEAVAPSVVSRVNDPVYQYDIVPRARPKDLALAPSVPAPAELGESLAEHHRRDPIPHSKRQGVSLPLRRWAASE